MNTPHQPPLSSWIPQHLSAAFGAGAFAIALCGFSPSLSAQDAAQPSNPTSPTAPPAIVTPLSGADRIAWITKSTIGPTSLLAGTISAGYGTAVEGPPEYSDDWKGFGARFGMRLSGVSLSNVIEGGLGAAWDEDPRYRRASQGSVWHRIGHAVRLSVMSRRPDGRMRPAYARYAGIVGSNVISNSWRVPSDSAGKDAVARSALGVSGRVVGNLFEEFWPDVWNRVH